MQSRREVGLHRESANLNGRETAFSGYWYRAPAEIDLLMNLKRTEIKVFMVINHAIERDRNRGLISMRQIQQRAKMKSLGHTQEAVDAVCRLGIFTRHNPSTGAKMTDPEEWKGRSVAYRFSFQWRQKDAENSSPTVVNAASQTNCSPPRERNCSLPGEQHSEFSEYTCSSVSVVVDASGNNKRRQADSRHVSPKNGEGSFSNSGARIAGEEAKRRPTLTDSEVTEVSNWLAAFMDGEQPPANLLFWVIELAQQYRLSADDIHRALNAAWNRNARPGRKNRPHIWNWFYEVLRTALVPGYAARVPEATS